MEANSCTWQCRWFSLSLSHSLEATTGTRKKNSLCYLFLSLSYGVSCCACDYLSLFFFSQHQGTLRCVKLKGINDDCNLTRGLRSHNDSRKSTKATAVAATTTKKTDEPYIFFYIERRWKCAGAPHVIITFPSQLLECSGVTIRNVVRTKTQTTQTHRVFLFPSVLGYFCPSRKERLVLIKR